MSYRPAVDAPIWLHLGFIPFVLFGGLLPLRWPRLAWSHLPAVAWGCAAESLDSPCPLTPLENRLHRVTRDASYNGGFVEHYLLSLIYPADLTPAVQWILGTIVLLVNLIAYLYLWHRHSSH